MRHRAFHKVAVDLGIVEQFDIETPCQHQMEDIFLYVVSARRYRSSKLLISRSIRTTLLLAHSGALRPAPRRTGCTT